MYDVAKIQEFIEPSGHRLRLNHVVPDVVKGEPTMTPIEIPCLFAYYSQGFLIIRQPLEALKTGIVRLIVLRQVGADFTELCSVAIQMERTTRPDETIYWYCEESLKKIIGEPKPGDHLIYCVDPE